MLSRQHHIGIQRAGAHSRRRPHAAQPICGLLEGEQIAGKRRAGGGDQLEIFHLAATDGDVGFFL